MGHLPKSFTHNETDIKMELSSLKLLQNSIKYTYKIINFNVTI